MTLTKLAMIIGLCVFAPGLFASDEEAIMLQPYTTTAPPWNPYGYSYDPNDPAFQAQNSYPLTANPVGTAGAPEQFGYSGAPFGPTYPPMVEPFLKPDGTVDAERANAFYHNRRAHADSFIKRANAAGENLKAIGEAGTRDEILKSANAMLANLAQRTNWAWEWAAKIYEDKNNPGTFYYGLPTTDQSRADVTWTRGEWPQDLERGEGVRRVGFTHSHPYINYTSDGSVAGDQFSPGDKAWVDDGRNELVSWTSRTPWDTTYTSTYESGQASRPTGSGVMPEYPEIPSDPSTHLNHP
jgi:hypothetical protein